MLEVKSLQFGYTKDKDVFSDVSFTIGEGEFIAIGGCNGSGKTTITRLLVGLEKPKSGHIIYKGQDITQAPPSERGQYISGPLSWATKPRPLMELQKNSLRIIPTKNSWPWA